MGDHAAAKKDSKVSNRRGRRKLKVTEEDRALQSSNRALQNTDNNGNYKKDDISVCMEDIANYFIANTQTCWNNLKVIKGEFVVGPEACYP